MILQNIDLYQKETGDKLVYHSIPEVDEFKAYIESITKSESNSRNNYIEVTTRLTARRQDEIRKFVINEQVLCALDSGYWETRYAYICDNASNIYRFSNRKSQEIFDAILAEFDEEQVAIELLALKARQLGISTKVALKFLQRLLGLPHTQAVMASINADKSELLGRMIQVCLEHQPWWLVPRMTTDRIKLTKFDNGSILSVQSGQQATGIAQGWTPTCVHISEIGDIPNPKKVLEEGLFKATHPTRKLFAVYEGTGNGNVGWQAETWRYAKENWPKRQSRLRPIFLPWPTAPDQYPEPDWLRKFPIGGGDPHWTPSAATRKHVQRCELYIRNTDYLAKVMGRKWEMPIEQAWYWEFNYNAAVASHTEKVWMSQMPADDFEALQGKNDSVFDTEVIDLVMKDRKKKYTAYAIKGNSIDDGFEPREEEIEYDKDRIRVFWESHRGQKYEWMMIPLLPFDETKEKNSLDKVLIFEEPREGSDYSIGIDTADGLGKDDEERSCMSIARNVFGESQDVQAAELTSNRINAPQMVGFAACLAAWYGEKTRDPRGCKFAIEQRTRYGDDCQLQLKLMGFTWHHKPREYDSKKLHDTSGHKEGWRSTAWTVAMMMARFVDAINGQWYKINSPWLAEECRNLERKIAAGKSKMEHQSGKFDDRVRAAAQSYFTRHDMDVLADRQKKSYALPKNALPAVNKSYATVAEVCIGD